MKLIRFLLVLLVGPTVLAQTPPQSSRPDIAIKRVYWTKRPPVPSTEPWPVFDQYYPSLEPYSLPRPPGPGRSNPPSLRRQAREYYIYSALIKNGAKAIKAVAWDYVFSDGETGKELGRYPLSSFDRIGRNQTATLTSTSANAPRKTTGAKGKAKSHPSIKELAELKCVLYADDSMFCQPDVPQVVPDLLRRLASSRRK